MPAVRPIPTRRSWPGSKAGASPTSCLPQMNVRWSRQALADLRGIRAYIAQDDPTRAGAVVSRLRESTRLLEQFPYAGRAGGASSGRELVVARLPYIILYRIERSTVVIVRIRHGAQRRPE